MNHIQCIDADINIIFFINFLMYLQSPIHIGVATPGEPASNHDETSSSDRTKDDDDGGASDDDSDDRVDPQHHDPERLKAFNVS